MLKFKPLPRGETTRGTPRHIGVEIEFSGLSEAAAADVLQDTLGGVVSKVAHADYLHRCDALGETQVYLDIRFRENAQRLLGDAAMDMARLVVPVEIVTEPLTQDKLPVLDRVVGTLAAAGARGTEEGWLLGFGVHFNPEVWGQTLDDLLPVITAYALCEDMIRAQADLDLSRRLLPFVDPWPRGFVDALVSDPPRDVAALIDLYLGYTRSRNHGLDLMCLFAHIDHDRVAAQVGMDSISARPTWHYRLPDCRIGEPDWSLAVPWNRWVAVEGLADDPHRLQALAMAWQTHRAGISGGRAAWAVRCQEVLDA
ncbi:amidoligase family protein [Mesobacterium sp. TK19101]|uniref:Amidoligase family protein n=1 Tax=Mesobacterium hydrothermale TaxID=3111907 RepID=A0ABU6HMH3_9RHOB|nr:amidoligase family protein [Mesobacterium sp. TK19101]MEC3862385.1 amidoligase family protein [Mesobacterium sp. TK19101]